MAVKIYQRMKEWWREPEENIPGATPTKNELRRKFIESKRYTEEDEDEDEESPVLGDEGMDDEEFDNDDSLNDESLVADDVENPEDIIDDVAAEDGSDDIADQITINIGGVDYNLVPTTDEDMNNEEGDLGIDAQAEMDDVSQPQDIPENDDNLMNDEESFEDEDEDFQESAKNKAKRALEKANTAKRIALIKEKILKSRKMKENEDNEFLNGEDEAVDASEENLNSVMESIQKRKALLKKTYEALVAKERKLKEAGELDLPKAKDSNGNFAARGHGKDIKSAYTDSKSGEDFTKKAGEDKSFAARKSGRDVKAAYTASAGIKAKDLAADDGFAGKSRGEDPKKAYTPSKSGDNGPTKVTGGKTSGTKRVEALLARRLRTVEEVEGNQYSNGTVKISGAGQKPVADQIGADVDTGAEMTDEWKDIEGGNIDVAKRTEISEKLARIRKQRLSRRNESVEKNGVVFPTEELKDSLEGSLKESFDFKKLIKGEY
jgi:hypothetical protein